MALFQIFRGSESTLNTVPLRQGYAYFCEDTGRFWIDIASSGPLKDGRIAIRGDAAYGLVMDDGTVIDADQFVQIGDISESGLLIGDGDGTITGLEVNVSELVVGTENGVDGLLVPNGALVIGKESGIAAKMLPIGVIKGVKTEDDDGEHYDLEALTFTEGQMVVGAIDGGLEDKSVAEYQLIAGSTTGAVRALDVPSRSIVLGGDNGVETAPLPGNNSVMLTNSMGEIDGIEMGRTGALYKQGTSNPVWDILPTGVGGTGQSSFTANSVLIGNGTNAVNTVGSQQGALYSTGNGVRPQFGILPVELGGTAASSAEDARENLEVYGKEDVYQKTETYSQSEVDTKLEEVNDALETVAKDIQDLQENDEDLEETIEAATTKVWRKDLLSSGWEEAGDEFQQTINVAGLRCGETGNIPPLITCLDKDKQESYALLTWAEATPGASGSILFTASEEPTETFTVIVVDLG